MQTSHPALPGIFIMQVPAISTAHITAQDGAQLRQNNARDSLAIIEDGHGHILHFAADSIADDFADQHGFTADFRALLQRFADLGFQYLRLDPDFNICPEFPTFDW